MWGEPIVGVLARISFPQFALALSIYFFFSPPQTCRKVRILEAPPKKSNWFSGRGQGCTHEYMVDGNEEFEHMLFLRFT
jgi:hypothetical protein